MTDSEKLDLILSEIKDLKQRTTNIELTLENETNPNIKAIAEGHFNYIL